MSKLLDRVGDTWHRSVVTPVRDMTGQTLAEYSILITVVAVGLTLLAMLAFREVLADAFSGVTGCLDGSC